jgi:hypothetical protein
MVGKSCRAAANTAGNTGQSAPTETHKALIFHDLYTEKVGTLFA